MTGNEKLIEIDLVTNGYSIESESLIADLFGTRRKFSLDIGGPTVDIVAHCVVDESNLPDFSGPVVCDWIDLEGKSVVGKEFSTRSFVAMQIV